MKNAGRLFAIGVIALQLILILSMSILTGSTNATPFGQSTSQAQRTSHKSAFRYVILDDDDQESYRIVSVLMDPKAFSESNLRELLRLMLKRFPKPSILHVYVWTSLDDLLTPEEEETEVRISETRDVEPIPKHRRALLVRDGSGKEWFRYLIRAGSNKEKFVVIKEGSDKPPGK